MATNLNDWRIIVGVVADIRDWSVESPPRPQFFIPLQDPSGAHIVIRSVPLRKDALRSSKVADSALLTQA